MVEAEDGVEEMEMNLSDLRVLRGLMERLPVCPLPVEQQPVGGRLAFYLENWMEITKDPWVLSVIKNGYRLQFQNQVPMMMFPKSTPLPKNKEKREVLISTVETMLEKKIVEEVLDVHTPGFYSIMFLVPKPGKKKWRSILDLSILNKFLIKEKFKMETIDTIRQELKQDEWATSIDFTDAYFHIKIHRADRKYLRFVIGERVFQFRSLPMGLSDSPRVFTRVIKVIKAWLQKRGVRMNQYLDDWLVRGQSFQLVQGITDLVLRLANRLGWIVSAEKSELIPKQKLVFLGVEIDLKAFKVRPTQKKWDKMQEWLVPFLQKDRVIVRQWLAILGLMASMSRLVRLGLLKMRVIQTVLREQWRQGRDPMSKWIAVSQEAKEAFLWWSYKDNVMEGVVVRSQVPSISVFTDSSKTGWGGHRIDGVERVSVWGVWTVQERELHINVLEMLAVFKVLIAWETELKGKDVFVVSDNVTVVSYIQKQEGKKFQNFIEVDTGIVRLDRSKTNVSEVSSHCREAECLGRSALETRSNTKHRVVHSSKNPNSSVVYLGKTSNRSVCHSQEQEDGDLCEPVPGSSSICSGCSLNSMEGHVGVCISPHKDSSKCAKQDHGRRVHHCSDSTKLASTKLVSRPVRVADRLPDRVTSVGDNVTSTSVINLPQESRYDGLTCVEIVENQRLQEGFSKEAASRMARATKASSRTIYEDKWRAFCDWCGERN